MMNNKVYPSAIRSICRITLNQFLILSIVIQTAASSSSVYQDDKSEAQINISVLYPDKTPVVGIVIRCYDQEEIHEALTNEDGIAVFKLEDTKERTVHIGSGDGSYLDWTPSKMQEYVTVARSLRDQFYCDGLFWKNSRRSVLISVGLISNREYQLVHSSTIHGRVVIEAKENPLQMANCRARISNHGITEMQKDGSFSLYGIPQHQNNEFYFWAFPDVYIASITSKQINQRDIDIGFIKIDPFDLPSQSILDIEVLKEDKDGRYRDVRLSGITMIHESGRAIFSFWGLKDGRLGVFPNGKKPPPLPAGRYWIAPAHFAATDMQLAVIDGVRSGLIDEDTDLQSLVMRAGETTTETIMMNKVYERIVKFIEKTDWKRENVPQITKSDDE